MPVAYYRSHPPSPFVIIVNSTPKMILVLPYYRRRKAESI